MAKASAAEAAVAAPETIRQIAARKTIQQVAARVLDATANSDGPGLLLRGSEYAPLLRSDLGQLSDADIGGVAPADLDSFVVDALVRLARVAGSVGDALRDCPDPNVRRSAAILAARAHPLRAAFDA